MLYPLSYGGAAAPILPGARHVQNQSILSGWRRPPNRVRAVCLSFGGQ